jgi:hypothetical protein
LFYRIEQKTHKVQVHRGCPGENPSQQDKKEAVGGRRDEKKASAKSDEAGKKADGRGPAKADGERADRKAVKLSPSLASLESILERPQKDAAASEAKVEAKRSVERRR